MCGIIGYIGSRGAGETLYTSLKRLEYRGYDSAGIAILKNRMIDVRKDKGQIEDINQDLNLEKVNGIGGIGHTRWASHGSVTRENAHPHTSCDNRFAIVHNGIIENWEELKDQLSDHEFTSETDSEVIAHYMEEKIKIKDIEDAIRDFLYDAEGSFAVALLDSLEDKIYSFKRGSPLAIGIGEDEVFLASDIYAFSPYTDKAVFLEDNEYAIIEGGNYIIKDENGNIIKKNPEKFKWGENSRGEDEFEHYMRREIEEIPLAIERLEKSIGSSQLESFERFIDEIRNHERIIFTGSGTSYHASMLGVYLLNSVGIEAQALIASEFRNYDKVNKDTLVIPISQSGETKDVMDAVEFSRQKGAKVASIVNVPYSTLERKSDINLMIQAGQEICVAATKTFINQIYLLSKIAIELGYSDDLSNTPRELRNLIRENEVEAKRLARELGKEENVFIIGKGETYPIALELALKLKEITYIHAEGMAGGELKHGTLALIEEGTPVISLIPEKNSEIRSNVKEVEARGAKSIKISPWSGEFKILKDNKLKFIFFSTVIGFLLTYWIGRERKLPIDKPRNLSKTLTVR